ncbi:Charged multivesicular body protein 7 [Eumeta japonica]|uniref:Charged multivesicular body protein 7 n=1 Tax=Eumeta variegata TaxID=151549 RepID=A0A4C1ZZ54_EUMVA|nr:Charged multivesicular body protein 7 [Eumeta japonica]
MDILNIFPEGLHPKCWSDDVRMKALFAPFRPKAANPESWETKVGFWSDMLRRWCRLRRDPVLSANEARLAFQRKGRTPDCIEIVVEECLKRGDLSPISKYLHILHKGSKSWRRWNARSVFKSAGLAVSRFVPFKRTIDQDRLPKASIDSNERFVVESVLKVQYNARNFAVAKLGTKPSQWHFIGTRRRRRKGRGASNLRTASFVGNSERQSIMRCTVFEVKLGLEVHLENTNFRFARFQEQATRLLSDYPSNFERFGTIEELMTNTKFNDIQRETFEVLLGYLISEGQATKKGKIIKLASPRRKASPVKKSDVTMHGLLASERKLTAEAEKFAKKAERALEEARVAIYRRNRLTAKNHLRRKHRYQQKIVSTEKALKNVHRLMHTMKKNELNAAVLDACRSIAICFDYCKILRRHDARTGCGEKPPRLKACLGSIAIALHVKIEAFCVIAKGINQTCSDFPLSLMNPPIPLWHLRSVRKVYSVARRSAFRRRSSRAMTLYAIHSCAAFSNILVRLFSFARRFSPPLERSTCTVAF